MAPGPEPAPFLLSPDASLTWACEHVYGQSVCMSKLIPNLGPRGVHNATRLALRSQTWWRGWLQQALGASGDIWIDSSGLPNMRRVVLEGRGLLSGTSSWLLVLAGLWEDFRVDPRSTGKVCRKRKGREETNKGWVNEQLTTVDIQGSTPAWMLLRDCVACISWQSHCGARSWGIYIQLSCVTGWRSLLGL